MDDSKDQYVAAAALIERVADDFAATRRALGLSLRKVAPDVGVSYQTLWRLEQGDDDIGTSKTVAVMRWLAGSKDASGGSR